MTSTVYDHYLKHLGPIYSWMAGDFDAGCAFNAQFFDEINLQPTVSSVAVDLGSGHGFQTVPLVRRGFRVKAIDNCSVLLAELEQHTNQLDVTTIDDDLLNFDTHLSTPIDAIVCMGDTVTHLESLDAVSLLIQKAAGFLEPNGVLCLSFRDYVSMELRGNTRFIPVRSDPDRIHTCFLEYHAQTVHVHDILHIRNEGGWDMSVGVYSKLRLSPDYVTQVAANHGLTLSHHSIRQGMIHLAFEPSTEGRAT